MPLLAVVLLAFADSGAPLRGQRSAAEHAGEPRCAPPVSQQTPSRLCCAAQGMRAMRRWFTQVRVIRGHVTAGRTGSSSG